MTGERTVEVRRHPQDWKKAAYRLSSLRDPRWDSIAGGVGRGTSREYIFGYVWCDAMISGELAHSCVHGPPPHEIKICITQAGNDPETYAQLKEQADAQRPRRK